MLPTPDEYTIKVSLLIFGAVAHREHPESQHPEDIFGPISHWTLDDSTVSEFPVTHQPEAAGTQRDTAPCLAGWRETDRDTHTVPYKHSWPEVESHD